MYDTVYDTVYNTVAVSFLTSTLIILSVDMDIEPEEFAQLLLQPVADGAGIIGEAQTRVLLLRLEHDD